MKWIKLKQKALLLIITVLLGIPFISCGVCYAQGEPTRDIREATADQVEKDADALDLQNVERYLEELNNDVAEYIPNMDFSTLVGRMVRGEFDFSFSDIFSGLIKFLFHEIMSNSRLLGELLVLAVICAVLQNIQSAFEKGTVGKVAWTICYLVMFMIAIRSFSIAMDIAKTAINDMVSFMHGMLPVLITLLSAMGNFTSAALFHPLTIAVLSGISTLIKNVIMPLLFFSAILGLVSNISEKFQVSKLAALFKQWAMALLGLFLTVFMGFLMVQGITGSVADGVALRTAKFATGTFVPVVGKMFADAIDAVVGTSLLLKNVVGMVGVIAVFFICAFPALKIISIMIIFKIAAAISQPISDSKLVDCLNTIANTLGLVFAAVASVGIMFFFVIAIVVGAGNVSLMMR